MRGPMFLSLWSGIFLGIVIADGLSPAFGFLGLLMFVVAGMWADKLNKGEASG